MKKIITLIAAVLMFASCDLPSSYYEPHTNGHGVKKQLISNGIEKVTIEGHEYLEFTESVYGGVSVAVVHSASCPCHNKEEEHIDEEN